MILTDAKFFVVAIVLIIILLGIFVFLFYIERKLSKNEKKLEILEKERLESFEDPVSS
ncbi:MAG: CcmD family protein [Bacteroidota bacterium]